MTPSSCALMARTREVLIPVARDPNCWERGSSRAASLETPVGYSEIRFLSPPASNFLQLHQRVLSPTLRGSEAVGMGIRHLVFLGLDVVGVACLTLAILTLVRGSAKCPYCISPSVRSSEPTPIDKLLYLIYVRPYRCRACRKRFHARKRVVTSVHENSRSAETRTKAAGGASS